jgi:hypothetical protein
MVDKGQDMGLSIDEPAPLAHLGDCLQASFTADNHHSLADDIMRALLHLSREAKTESMRATFGSSRGPEAAFHSLHAKQG